jgi:membrane protease YdiL (CAAX protease family)
MSHSPNKLWAMVWGGIVAFLILALGAGAWGSLLLANFGKGPALPWAVPVMALVLWLMWKYLGGKWWPESTSEARRTYLRANRVSGAVFAWSLLAGVLSIVALTGYWIVMFRLVKMSPNLVPDMSRYPLLTTILVLVTASLVSPITEEVAFRGYCQVRLERAFTGPAAVAISSVYFSLAHLTQGIFWPKLFVYFLAGLAFGVTAYLTRSLLPGLAVHVLADLTFFTLVWPRDATRLLISQHGADVWFWIHVAQAIGFTAIAILAYRKLAKVSKQSFGLA